MRRVCLESEVKSRISALKKRRYSQRSFFISLPTLRVVGLEWIVVPTHVALPSRPRTCKPVMQRVKRAELGSRYQPGWHYHRYRALYYQPVLPWHYHPQCEPGYPNSGCDVVFITGFLPTHWEQNATKRQRGILHIFLSNILHSKSIVVFFGNTAKKEKFLENLGCRW